MSKPSGPRVGPEVVNRSRPTRGRRPPSAITAIKDAIIAALKEDNPMTVRQVFYRLVSEGVIAKTEGEYKSTVGRLLVEMRRAREIPFGWIADNTRWMRKPRTHGSLHQMLWTTAQTYRRQVWDNQDVYVEVWLEKDALAGVLYEATARWDVPLMVTRGYPSLSYLSEAAEAIGTCGKPAHLYYFGDYDPSGLDIPIKVERDLRAFAPGADITFNRVAILEGQIDSLNLPTRPTKTTDSRSRGFGNRSVEVDAIPPRMLRSMVRGCIDRHIDPRAYRTLLEIEQGERQTLGQLADWYEAREGGKAT
jgi:hypothetical protein